MWVTASMDKPMSKNGLRSVENHLNCRRRSIQLRTTFLSERTIMWQLLAPCSICDHIWLKLGKSRHETKLERTTGDARPSPTHNNEMCNFYIMYWVDGDRLLDNGICTSQGPPGYYFGMDKVRSSSLDRCSSLRSDSSF